MSDQLTRQDIRILPSRDYFSDHELLHSNYIVFYRPSSTWRSSLHAKTTVKKNNYTHCIVNIETELAVRIKTS